MKYIKTKTMSPRNKHIIIIEDNRDDQELIKRAFRKSGLVADITTINDGAEALDYMHCKGNFKQKPKIHLPSLIFLDLKLPKIDGKEVLEEYRKHNQYQLIPVIILSSSGEKKDINDCYRLGANSYIIKPIDYRKFLTHIDKLLAFWCTVNEQYKE